MRIILTGLVAAFLVACADEPETPEAPAFTETEVEKMKKKDVGDTIDQAIEEPRNGFGNWIKRQKEFEQFEKEISQASKEEDLERVRTRIRESIQAGRICWDDKVKLRQQWKERLLAIANCGDHANPNNWIVEDGRATCKHCGRFIGRVKTPQWGSA